jgi:hypothetical protein
MFPHSSNSIFLRAMAVRNALWSLLFLAQSQLQTSSCTFSSNGTIDFARFSIPTASSTSYFNHPSVAIDLGTVTVAPGHSYSIAKFSCPAGQAIAFELSAMDGTSPTYFQDYDSSPLACTLPLARAVLMHRRGCDQAI